MPVQSKTIKIEVYGGCVTEVTGLPEGYDYEIVDHDHLEAEQAGVSTKVGTRPGGSRTKHQASSAKLR